MSTTDNLFAPDENQAAYRSFIAPKQPDYQIQNISDEDISSVIANLDSMELRDQIKFLITLSQSERKTQARMEKSLAKLEKGLNLLVDKICKTKIYTLIHKDKYLMKFGYSENIENRLRTHKKDWIIVATEEGSKQAEDRMKKILKDKGFLPMPCTEEVHEITPEIVDTFAAADWCGVRRNRELILKKDRQLNCF